jgi:MscS family membrane protein
MVSPDRLRVRFTGYGACSLDLEIYAYLKCQTQDSYLAITEDLMLRIMELVTEAGTAFAFPSQVNYLGRDGGVDVAQREQREAEVRQWRQRDKLPFPDFEEEDVDQFGDTLDYPPRGSPHYTPRSRQ